MTASEEPRMTACTRRMVWLNNRPAPEEWDRVLSVYRLFYGVAHLLLLVVLLFCDL